MRRQKSFENERPTLYLVPTPIGNLSEMTPRAIEILQSVDVIACEDTRTSGQLLKHFNISKRLIAYQNFNEESSAKGILNLLSQGNQVALISDAGYPIVNDPLYGLSSRDFKGMGLWADEIEYRSPLTKKKHRIHDIPMKDYAYFE